MRNPIRFKTFDQLSFTDVVVYSKLPAHPFWDQIEKKIDFSFADQLCSVLYCGRGQLPYAPSLKLKIHLVQTYYRLSDRQTEEKIIGDLFIKRFLGLPVDFFGFDHSTIALDRNRLGTCMFHACHLYILAQMYSLRLWGAHDEQWIIDSFPSNAGIVCVSAFRLIQESAIRVVRHLERSYPDMHKLMTEQLMLDALTVRLNDTSSTSERLIAFSKVVGQAHALLHWFDTEKAALLFGNWNNKEAQQKSSHLQAVLKQVLLENSRPVPPNEPDADADSQSDDTSGGDPSAADPDGSPETEPPLNIQFEKIPRKERPSHRIVSAHQPDARIGKKSRFQMIKGYKTQNLCTTSGVVLEARAIPASESDHEAMYDMVRGIQVFFGVTPQALIGDTAYGFPKQRIQLGTIGVEIVAPVGAPKGKSDKYNATHFTYHHDKDVYTCPNGVESCRKSRQNRYEGYEYQFPVKQCETCPLRQACTDSKTGRSVFHSDYYEWNEQASQFNETAEGQTLLAERILVERKNQELKNDCGLGETLTRSRAALQMKATLAAIVVNMKLVVRRLIAPSPGFLRRMRKT